MMVAWSANFINSKEESFSITKDKQSYNIQIHTDRADKGIEVVGQAIATSFEKIIPQVGAGAAAGAIGSAALKATASLPPMPRLSLSSAVATTTIVGGASAKIGIDLGSTISNYGLSSMKNSVHAVPTAP